MLKFIYKLLGLIVVFVVALFIFSKNIEVITVHVSSEKVKPEGESFPILNIVDGDSVLNPMYGYSSNISANTVRESITVIDSDKSLTLEFNDYKIKVNKLSYEIRSVEDNEEIDSGTVTAFVMNGDKHAVNIKFDAEFDTSKEYALKITLVTNVSKKINYYTRIKYYPTDCYLKEKVDFVKNFHQMTIDKNEKLALYIEPDKSKENTSFALVDIHSSYDNITWADLKPEVLTEIVPIVREINIETGSLELRYFVRINTPTGKETYFVKEFYRLRRTEERIFMLWFERTMEAEYDTTFTSVNKNELKFGIANTDGIQVVSNDNVNKVAFVRNGNVYEYDLTTNVIENIYLGYVNQDEYDHRLYRQYDSHIISVDEEGNINFVVYGYISRGAYEGKVAIVLYKYHITDRAVEELLYIPFETTYQMLKENFEEYCYLNSGDVFYFAIDDKVYSYSLVAEKLISMSDGVQDRNFMIIPKTNSYVWESRQDSGISTEITLMDLENEDAIKIGAEAGHFIRLIGIMDTNIVYGTGNISDISATPDGTRIFAMDEVKIINNKNELIKSYSGNNVYVIDAEVEDNVVNLKRVKKDDNGSYKRISDDNILNRVIKPNNKVELTMRVTDKMMTEYYLSFPSGLTMGTTPKNEDADMFVVTSEKSLYLDNPDESTKYYVYAKGEIKGAFRSPAEAIIYADEEQGVVINNSNNTVWERGGKFLQGAAMGVEYANTSKKKKINSIEACTYMMLKTQRAPVSLGDIGKLNLPATDILSMYLDEPVNLTGCTLDEVLYFVSAGKPVLAMRDGKKAVLITGYNSSTVTIYDPAVGEPETLILTAAETIFKEAGNVYVGYMKGD